MKRQKLALTGGERTWLEQVTSRGSLNHQAFKRAQILLAATEPEQVTDARLAKVIGVSEATIYNTRRRYLSEGAEATVLRKARKDKGIPQKVDGRVEARIIALACSATPNEEPAWTLSMLADKLVELELVASISREKVRQVLKKTSSDHT
jgi:putative transposase